MCALQHIIDPSMSVCLSIHPLPFSIVLQASLSHHRCLFLQIYLLNHILLSHQVLPCGYLRWLHIIKLQQTKVNQDTGQDLKVILHWPSHTTSSFYVANWLNSGYCCLSFIYLFIHSLIYLFIYTPLFSLKGHLRWNLTSFPKHRFSCLALQTVPAAQPSVHTSYQLGIPGIHLQGYNLVNPEYLHSAL